VIPNGGAKVTFTWSGLPPAEGFTYFRFRLCTTLDECDQPTGVATDGEVEDYRVAFDFSTTAVTIGDVSLAAVSVAQFINQLNVEGMTKSDLIDLLEAFDSRLAASLADADIASILDALMGYLDPDGDGQLAIFEWETLYQHGTLGFFAERKGDSGNWVRVNNDMLPAMMAPLGANYMLVDPKAVSGNAYNYRLIEHEAKGSRRMYGPFDLRMP
jgi:hypothetical protein